ncbi:MAG TPA: hypothetical protein VF121_14560 [Thermoanaerobaculia bacterium]|nr:hypothetical protein [Thermoanaerobaculia bacterium]
MFELKRLSKEGVPAALEKAQRYRLLNEALEAESICLDVLEVEPENQRALTTLLLALTDQFEERLAEAVPRAREVLERFRDAYARAYYEGIVWERRAKAQLRRGGPGAAHAVYAGLREAMACFERAGSLRPSGDDEAILRWNTCARLLMSHRELTPAPPDAGEQMLE